MTDRDRVFAAVRRSKGKGMSDGQLLTACGIGDKRTMAAATSLFLDGKLRHNAGRWYAIGVLR